MGITSKEQLEAIKAFLKQESSFTGKSIEEIREDMRAAAARMPPVAGAHCEPVHIGNLKGEWIRPAGSTKANEFMYDNKAILYFHGGGFVAGTSDFYRDLTARIAISSKIPVLFAEYRLAPEHRFPAANEDCLQAYHWLLEQGYQPGHIIMGGDSVGATLVLMTLLTLRDQGEELAAGAFLLSPHTDLVNLDGESFDSNAQLDPTGSREASLKVLLDFLGPDQAEKPAILSPLRMDLKGLPKLLIQVGDQEVLLSDAQRFAERSLAAGVKVELEVWPGMWSLFHYLAYMLPEGQEAIEHIGVFARRLVNDWQD